MVLFYLTIIIRYFCWNFMVLEQNRHFIYNGVSYAIYGNSETEEISENYDLSTRYIIELKQLKNRGN